MRVVILVLVYFQYNLVLFLFVLEHLQVIYYLVEPFLLQHMNQLVLVDKRVQLSSSDLHLRIVLFDFTLAHFPSILVHKQEKAIFSQILLVKLSDPDSDKIVSGDTKQFNGY